MSRIVFKILKPVKGFPGISYNEKKVRKEKARLVFFINFPYHNPKEAIISEKEARAYIEAFSSKNKRIKFPQFHAIVSAKNKNEDYKELIRVGLGIMEKMGYGSNPTLAYLHNDTKNLHLHIISTRVDSNGRKISDKFEGIRTNNFLNDLLLLNCNQLVEKDIKEVFSYKASTLPQYLLLFELKGYNVRQRNQQLELYKYGRQMKIMPVKDLEALINPNIRNDVARIRALIFKYRQLYSSDLVDQKKQVYEGKKENLGSDLTNFLHQRMGIQLTFFKAKEHDKPYGYAVIDHKNKSVYKGSEIMKLEALINEKSNSEDIEYETELKKGLNSNDPDINNPNFDREKLEQKYIPELPIEVAINRIENEVEKDLGREHDVKKKIGRSFI